MIKSRYQNIASLQVIGILTRILKLKTLGGDYNTPNAFHADKKKISEKEVSDVY